MKLHALSALLVVSVCTGGLAQSSLQTAEQLSQNNRYQESVAVLDIFIQENPGRKYDLAKAWWLQSGNLLHLGQTDAAVQANAQSQQLRNQLRSDDLAENHLRSAQIALSINQPGEALGYCQQGLSILVDDPLVYTHLNLCAATASFAIQQPDLGFDYLEVAAQVIEVELGEAHPRASALWLIIGDLFFAQQAWKEADAGYLKAYHLAQQPLDKTLALLKKWATVQTLESN